VAGLAAGSALAALLVAGCSVLLLVHEAYGFKILMDEVMLLGTSMSMHLDKTALVPMRGHDIQGRSSSWPASSTSARCSSPSWCRCCMISPVTAGKRLPLNTVLTFVLLTLTYLTGCRISGRGAGVAAVLLLTSLPLLAQNATGGGFELLNLVMILATLLLGMRYVARRDAHSLEAFGWRYPPGQHPLRVRPLSPARRPDGAVVWWSDRKPVVTWLSWPCRC